MESDKEACTSSDYNKCLAFTSITCGRSAITGSSTRRRVLSALRGAADQKKTSPEDKAERTTNEKKATDDAKKILKGDLGGVWDRVDQGGHS